MFPVHVICNATRLLYEDALEQHFRLRHRIFVDELGWSALRKPDGREVDQFDTKHSIYLLGIEPGCGVVAGTRLGPSLEAHLVSDVFPHAAAHRGVPRAPHIYDWTRMFVAPARRGERRPCRAAGTIKTAVLEYCLANGIRQVTGLGEPYWIPALSKLGWNPQPLGLPIDHEGKSIFAFTCDVTLEALQKTRSVFGFVEPVLVDRKPTAFANAHRISPPSMRMQRRTHSTRDQ